MSARNPETSKDGRVAGDATRPPDAQQGSTPQEQINQDIQAIKKILKDLQEDLAKEEDTIATDKVAGQVAAAIRKTNTLETRVNSTQQQPGSAKEGQLDRIENALKTLARDTSVALGGIKGTPGQSVTSQRSWASVAAGDTNSRLAAAITAAARTPTDNPAIRIRLIDYDTKQHTTQDIHKHIKQYIPDVFAVRPLQSGDVDAFVTNQAIKEKLINGPAIENIKILRQDYPIEVQGVPLNTLPEDNQREASKTLAQQLKDENQRHIKGIEINTIR